MLVLAAIPHDTFHCFLVSLFPLYIFAQKLEYASLIVSAWWNPKIA